MTRFCTGCRLHRALREFDLSGGQARATCRACARARTGTPEQQARAEYGEKLASLESQRRSLIAALVKIDAEIAALRGRSAPVSSTFERVEPGDVFDAPDGDLGFGD